MVVYKNTDGAVCIADGGTPRIFTFKARADISGGFWINGSSAGGVVGSNASTYAAADIEGYPVVTTVGSNVIGLALTNVASGTYGAAAMRGIFLLPAASGIEIGSIYAGTGVLAGSAGTVVAWASGTHLTRADAAGWKLYPVGRALTTADSAVDQFVAVSLNL